MTQKKAYRIFSCSRIAKVPQFSDQLEKFKSRISISGKSRSTYRNYAQHLAKLVLRFECLPTELDEDQISDYLYHVQQQHNTPSESYFKHSMYKFAFSISIGRS
ncbi:MAG: phage integrase N-terminal SAM-like domain-containing protein [Bacteroidetes bacterium]|nr:phage integrase N-terminal SAM-like domain-containing protein [Bacteroidota bacterium]